MIFILKTISKVDINTHMTDEETEYRQTEQFIQG